MAERSGLQFVIFGVPVRVEPWFFLISLLALQTRDVPGAAIWAGLVFMGVLVHELGHAMAMRANGFSPSITLHGLGGFTAFNQGANPTPKQNFFITLAGPMAGLTLGGIALLVDHFVPVQSPYLAMAIDDAKRINIFWSVINLLPILPWDGGLILDSALQWRTQKARAHIVAICSMVGGGLILAYAIKERQLFFGYFGAMGVWHGYNRWKALSGNAPQPITKPPNDEHDERLLLEEVERTSDPGRRAALFERLAWIKLQRGDLAGAKLAMRDMGAHVASPSLRARMAASENDAQQVIELLSIPGAANESDRPLLISAFIAKDRFDEALELARNHPEIAASASTKLFEAGAYAQALELCTAERIRTGDGVHAYNEACCYCRLGRLDDAVTALQKAKALGYADLRHLQTDEDLEPIRNRPEVQALLRN